MTPHSAGLLLYRLAAGGTEVLLVHPGGPLWRNRWQGWWQLPKGAIEAGEAPIDAARREFGEELGHAPAGPVIPLGEVRQRAGKRVTAFACRGDLDPAAIVSATFEIEWPPRSGKRAHFPEVDAARWFALAEARAQILPSQMPFLDRLEQALAGG